MMRRILGALITLMFISPLIAELLTTSTPPWNFFNPINLLILIGFYGSGVALIREFRLRNNLKYVSLIPLGIAYGVLEEGIAVRSFFNPEWKDLGIYHFYGRWIGVNWVWSFYLVIFHGIYSICIPIIITEALFKKVSGKQWINIKGNILLLTILTCLTLLFQIAIPYTIDTYIYIICLLIIFILVNASKYMKPFKLIRTISYKKYFILWTIWALFFFISMWVFPYIIPYPLILIIFSLIILFIAFVLISYIDINGLDKLVAWSFMAGATIVIALIDILSSFEPHNLYKFFIGSCYIVFLIIIFLISKKPK